MAGRIDVISDTHGLLRQPVKDQLQGSDLIVHAGDIGSPSVLEELRQIARVVAVRGNVDGGGWARELSPVEYFEVDHTCFGVVHDIRTLDVDPAAARLNVVIYGHSHQPSIAYADGILYLNPGSAGPRRFDLPVSMARLRFTDEGIVPELIEL